MARTPKAKPTRREEIDTEIATLERLYADAHNAGSYQAAVAARRAVAQMMEERGRLDSEERAKVITDPIERVRWLQRAASEAGSWVAAASLLKQEQEMVEAARAKAEAEAKAKRGAMSEDEIVRTLTERLRTMPLKLRQKVLASLNAPAVN